MNSMHPLSPQLSFNHFNFYPSQKSLLYSCLLAWFSYPLGLTRTSVWNYILITDRLSIRNTAKEYFLMS